VLPKLEFEFGTEWGSGDNFGFDRKGILTIILQPPQSRDVRIIVTHFTAIGQLTAELLTI